VARTFLSAKSLDIHKFDFLIQEGLRAVCALTFMRKNHGISAKPQVIKRLSIGATNGMPNAKARLPN